MFKHLLLVALYIAPIAQAVSETQMQEITIPVQQSSDPQSAVLENINRFNGYEQIASQVSRRQPSQKMQLVSEQDKEAAYGSGVTSMRSPIVIDESSVVQSETVLAKPHSANRTQFEAISALLTSTSFSNEQKIKLIQVLSN